MRRTRRTSVEAFEGRRFKAAVFRPSEELGLGNLALALTRIPEPAIEDARMRTRMATMTQGHSFNRR
jgi:hypothetical protein